jgi:hypothetical protein
MASSTITSEGNGDVWAATEPDTGAGHGSLVPTVVGATVELVGASVVVVDARDDVVARTEVVLPAVLESSSPLQPAIASAPASTNEAIVRTRAR